MKYLILVADPDEYAPFTARLAQLNPVSSALHSFPCTSFDYKSHSCTAVCTYIGKVNAAAACCTALCSADFDAVINLGYSGAVSGLLKGDIVAGESYVECDFDLTPIGYAPGEKTKNRPFVNQADSRLLQAAQRIPGIKTVKLGTGDFFLTNKVLRDKYRELFDISAFDMETGAIANACAVFGKPFLSVRKISDNADDTASSDYSTALVRDEKPFGDILIALLDELSM